jgi:hypothetical protein
MPFRDIDFNKVKHDTELMQKLNRDIAIINASANRDLEKVEFLSGVKLYTPDPIKEQIEQQQAVARQQPVLDKLNELVELSSNPITTGQIADIIRKNIPAITQAHPPQPPEPLEFHGAVEESPKKPAEKPPKQPAFDIDKELDAKVLREHGFEMPSKLTAKTKEELQGISKNVGAFNKAHSGWKNGTPEEQYALENTKTYLIRVNRIKDNLDIREMPPDANVTLRKKKAAHTSSAEQEGEGIYFTNMKDLYDRLLVLVGELQAGNTSKKLRNELGEIAHHLYKNKVITKPKYRTLLKAI